MSAVATSTVGRGPRLIHLTTIDLSLQVLLAHQLVRFAEEGYDVSGASAPGPYVEGLGLDRIGPRKNQPVRFMAVVAHHVDLEGISGGCNVHVGADRGKRAPEFGGHDWSFHYVEGT